MYDAALAPAPTSVPMRIFSGHVTGGAAWVFFFAMGVFLVCYRACGGPEGPQPRERPPRPGDLPDEQAFLAQIDRSRGTRDCFEVIRDPIFVGVDGAHGITDDEIVLGVDVGSARFAYPIQLLNFHEIVEHSVEGLDLLACW